MISGLVKAQLDYHQEAHQLLSDIFPQVNDMASAQIALQSLPSELVTESNTPETNPVSLSPLNSELNGITISPTSSHGAEDEATAFSTAKAADRPNEVDIKATEQEPPKEALTVPVTPVTSSETPATVEPAGSQEPTPALSPSQTLEEAHHPDEQTLC